MDGPVCCSLKLNVLCTLEYTGIWLLSEEVMERLRKKAWLAEWDVETGQWELLPELSTLYSMET